MTAIPPVDNVSGEVVKLQIKPHLNGVALKYVATKYIATSVCKVGHLKVYIKHYLAIVDMHS